MKRRPFIPADGVSNIELFYDLIFVYCISVLTSLCHHVHGDFLDLNTWTIYMFSFLVVLQVWFFTTFLMNRYGDRSAGDNVCLFVNMFLLYFLASGIQTDWNDTSFTFNLSWALIIVNLIVHWVIKLIRYDNLDDDDKRIMKGTIIVLAIQLVVVLVAAVLEGNASVIASWIALFFGAGVFALGKNYRRKPARFAHLSERCALLVIIAFGETIVAIASYMTGTTKPVYPILVFALVVGLFLIYIYEHDNMVDHHKDTDGMAYLTLTGWVILIIGNLAVGLEYMPMEEIAFLPKSMYITATLVLYLLTSFLLGRYNKPEFHYSPAFVIGRLAACAFVIVVAAVTNFDPLINLVCDTAAVYLALWHEWLLYHRRTRIIAYGESLGYSQEDYEQGGMTFTTAEGRRSIMQALRAAKQVEVQKRSAKSTDGDVDDAKDESGDSMDE